jgi:integral membrane protein
MDRDFLQKLRLLATVEAISTLLLFGIAVPLKYVYGQPLATKVIGPIHGILFMGLVVMNSMAVERVPIGKRLCMAGIVGAVLPFGPFVVDRWLKRLLVESDA